MSKADDIFIKMCRDILENGTSTEGEKMRPHWEDGTAAYTIKQFGVCNRYDLSEEFPAITLRKTAVKSATNEMLWIWQKKSNNINDLKSTVWDEWADEDGSIGKAYGYQMSVKHFYKDITEDNLVSAFGKDWEEKGRAVRGTKDNTPGFFLDQVNRVLYDLKINPFSRRIMTNIYVHEDLFEMNLYPCAYSLTFNVTTDKKDGELVLNAVLNQRSQDILAANNWNVCQYAVLIYMLSQTLGMKPGILVHMIADAHIYDRHIPIIKELIERETHPAPIFSLNKEIHDFYDFSEQDITLSNYITGEQVKNIPIAV